MTAGAGALLLVVAAAQASSWGAKDFGVLIVGGTASPAGGKAAAGLKDALKGKFPVEFASGLGDAREIQGAIDRLTSQRVKKLVVVPLVLYSESSAMDETKYVFGLRKDPSAEFFLGGHSGHTIVRRAQTKLPVVMSSGLDEHPLVAETLAARAKELSEHPERERFVLVGRGAASDAENESAARTLASLARKVRETGRFAAAQAFVLREDAPVEKRDKARLELRKAVKALSRGGRVILVAHMLAPDGLERTIRKLLDGHFFVFNAKALMPDARLAKWVEAKAGEAAKLPDMRQFKDAGRPLPPPERKKLLQLPGSPTLKLPSTPKPLAPGAKE